MLVVVFCIAAISIWSIIGWSRAARALSDVYSKSIEAERFRTNINRQLSYAFDFINGEPEAEANFWEIQETADNISADLKRGADSQVELEHIEGLEETQYELVWIMRNFFEQYKDGVPDAERRISRVRLEEITDEVADDMATISQYYREQENRSLAAANKAGRISSIVISAAVIFAIIQLFILVFTLQRWLAMPIAIIGKRLKEISAGNLESEIQIKSSDEWGRLAAAINNMARSLQTSQRKLLAQERLAALGEVASFSAHNLRNPLAGIRAAAQVASADQSHIGAETAETFREIIESVDRLDGWIKRFLEFARPLTIQPEKTDINSLVTQATSIARSAFPGSTTQLKLELTDEIPPVDVDSILMEQAIFVIVANSFEAVREGGSITIATAFEHCDGDNGWANIVVSDNGGGIPEQIRDRLFRPFVSRKEGGTGLGLAQAKKITDIHGGKISIDHLPGGTRVEIKLPVNSIPRSKE